MHKAHEEERKTSAGRVSMETRNHQLDKVLDLLPYIQAYVLRFLGGSHCVRLLHLTNTRACNDPELGFTS